MIRTFINKLKSGTGVYFALAILAWSMLLPKGASAQANLALSAAATVSSGGSCCGYEPTKFNDNVIQAQASCFDDSYASWGWVEDYANLIYTWGTPVTVGKIVAYNSGRPFTNCNVDYWNGSSWVTITSWVTPGCFSDSISFTPVTTTILRMSGIHSTISYSPSFREVQVFASGAVSPPAAPTVSGTTTYCEGATISLTASSAASSPVYVWTGPGSFSSTGATLSISSSTPAHSGSYSVTVTSGSLTSAATVTMVKVSDVPSPAIVPSGATAFCDGESVMLAAKGAAGKSLMLNGSNQGVSVNPTGAALSGLGLSSATFTLEAWVNYSSSTASAQSIIRKGGDYNFYVFNNNLYAEIWPAGGGSSWIKMIGVATLTPNTWTHVAATWNGSTCKLYINGVEDLGAAPTAMSPSANDAYLAIGFSQFFTNYFGGKIDEVRIWNTTRTVSELAANKSKEVSPASAGLVAYYKLNEASGTAVINAVGNGNNGTLVNSPIRETSTAPMVFNSYAWTPGSETSASVTATTSGNYSATVTNGAGCTGTNGVAITVNPLPVFNAGESTAICIGASATLMPVGDAATYSWSPSLTTYDSAGFGGTVNPESTTTYTLTGTSTSGCVATSTVTVAVNSLPVITTSADTAICYGESAVLTATSATGTYFTWAPTPSLPDTGAVIETIMPDASSSYTATPTETTVYTVTATSSEGCVSTANVTVVVNPLPYAGIISGDSTVNMSGTTTLTSSVEGGTWSVSNSHATISSTGVVSGVSSGTVTVSYSYTNVCGTDVATFLMHVNTPIVEGSTVICMGATTTLGGFPGGGAWSSGNIPRAVVNAAGVVTGMSAGTVNISYNVGGSITVTVVTVNTTPSVFTGLTSFCIGTSTTIGSTPTGGTWTSSEPTVGEISTTGVLSGSSLGITTISYELSNGCSRSVVATVNSVPSEISGITTICVGGSTTLTNEVSGGVFSSSNSLVATTTMGGTVTGVAAGTATISYSMGGCRVTTMVSVTAAPAITGTAAACVGATTSLSNAITGGSWSSSNSLVADVDASGLVTGIAGGTATISYATSTGCSRTQVVTINATPVISGASTVCIGGTANLTSTPATTSWASSTPSAATINGSGLVTGVAAGTTTIAVVSAAGCTNNTIISVSAQPTITGTQSACIGATTSLTGAASGGSWSSSSTGIASVSASTGMVTGVNAGTATMSYSLGGGCLRTAVVTIKRLTCYYWYSCNVCERYCTTCGFSCRWRMEQRQPCYCYGERHWCGNRRVFRYFRYRLYKCYYWLCSYSCCYC
jgi:uncharacterized protein YjdB